MPEIYTTNNTYQSVISNLFETPIVGFRMICHGKNSRVYHVETDDSNISYIAKFYYQHPFDKHNRLEVEFNSLKFLLANGIRNVPRPLVVDIKSGCAVYEAIEGSPINMDDISIMFIREATQFLSQLKSLSSIPASGLLPDASDAFFSFEQAVSAIRERFHRLNSIAGESLIDIMLETFLKNEFLPAFSTILGWLEKDKPEYINNHVLPRNKQTLSPSDFGFHNAIRSTDGQLSFIDFEYFGWDDPAKMISDILLHPAMNLTEFHKKQFVESLLEIFDDDVTLPGRLVFCYPLCGLIWCMILLNEFIPRDMKRRKFAASDPFEEEDIKRDQLMKAENMLKEVLSHYESFPYYN